MRLFFVHIPKTAGTSFFKTAIEPRWEIRHYAGLKDFVFQTWKKKTCIRGHVPYGQHLFKPFHRFDYLTFLRDPIERAISHYFFVISTSSSQYTHPELHIHQEVPIEEIFEYNKSRMKALGPWGILVDNMQTRYLAGIPFTHKESDLQLLKRAKHNLLKNFVFWGLQNQYEASLDKFQKKYDIPIQNQSKRYQQSKKEELSETQLNAVINANRLDMELFEFAQKHF